MVIINIKKVDVFHIQKDLNNIHHEKYHAERHNNHTSTLDKCDPTESEVRMGSETGTMKLRRMRK